MYQSSSIYTGYVNCLVSLHMYQHVKGKLDQHDKKWSLEIPVGDFQLGTITHPYLTNRVINTSKLFTLRHPSWPRVSQRCPLVEGAHPPYQLRQILARCRRWGDQLTVYFHLLHELKHILIYPLIHCFCCPLTF